MTSLARHSTDVCVCSCCHLYLFSTTRSCRKGPRDDYTLYTPAILDPGRKLYHVLLMKNDRQSHNRRQRLSSRSTFDASSRPSFMSNTSAVRNRTTSTEASSGRKPSRASTVSRRLTNRRPSSASVQNSLDSRLSASSQSRYRRPSMQEQLARSASVFRSNPRDSKQPETPNSMGMAPARRV